MRRSLLNKLNTPKALRQALVLITMLLLPSAAWGYDNTNPTVTSNFTGFSNNAITFDGGSTGQWEIYAYGDAQLESDGTNTGLKITPGTVGGGISFKLKSKFVVSQVFSGVSNANPVLLANLSASSDLQDQYTAQMCKAGSEYNTPLDGIEVTNSSHNKSFKTSANFTLSNDYIVFEFQIYNCTYFTIQSINLYNLNTPTPYNLTIAGIPVTNANASNITGSNIVSGSNGKVSFTPANNYSSSDVTTWATLTLDNAEINGIIDWSEPSNPDFRILVNGTSKIINSTTDVAAAPAIQYTYTSTGQSPTPVPRLHISKGSADANLFIASYRESDTNISNSTPINNKFSTPATLDNGMSSIEVYPDDQDNYDIMYTCYTTATVYPNLKVANRVVHDISENYQGYKSNILKGKYDEEAGAYKPNKTVTFDGNHTLTLNNATIDVENIPGILTGMDLTIELDGTNTIKTNNGYAICGNGDDHNITFTSSSTPTGTLTLSREYSAGLTENITFTESDWAITILSGTTLANANQAIISKSYGLSIAGTEVTSANVGADGTITGVTGAKFAPSTSYNASDNTTWAKLTLTNADIQGQIQWSKDEGLIIEVNGMNKVINEKTDAAESAISWTGTQQVPNLLIKKGDSESATLIFAGYKKASGYPVQNASNQVSGFSDPTYQGLNYGTLTNKTTDYTLVTYHCYSTEIYPVRVRSNYIQNISEEYYSHKDNVIDDSETPTVTYNNGVLTLNNANFYTGIGTGMENLTIDLKGNNIISTSNNSALLYGIGDGTHNVKFKSTSDPVGTLRLKSDNEAIKFANGVTISYENDLEASDDLTNASVKEVTIGKGLIGIIVAGVIVTEDNAANIQGNGITVEEGGKVMFDTSTNTLTLNGAILTDPIIIGLSELTIDIQGTNSITTDEICIQKMENTTPAVTFTSTSDVAGSLTLKGAAGVNDVGEYNEGSFTISDKLALVLKKDGYVYSNQYYFTDRSTKEAILSPSYGVTVGGMQICQDNAADVIGEGIGNGKQGGMVKFTPAASDTPATLTLNGATISGTIKSSLNDLIIKIAGSSNTLTAILYEGSSNGTLLFQNAPSSSSNVNKLTLQNSTGAVFSGFSTVTLDGLFFSTPNYPSVTTSTDWTSSIIEAIITNEYGITIGGVDVTTTNKDDVLNDEGTVKFTPADNTATPATPATLTLNGAKITGTVFWTNSAPLTIAINGTNSVTTTDAYAIEGNNQDNTTLTIAKVSETGKCKLILSGSTGGSISGFKNSSDTYAGSGLVYYEDQAEHTATILSTLSGSGTSTDPYLIETPEDLKDFSFFVNKQIITNKYIKIANNIDCKDLEGFESIGSSYPFMGTLSGYGNTISNLTINSGLGFFGHISGGIVNDLNFYKLSVKGNSYATGGIASELSAGGQIDNCTLTECTIACLDNQYSPEVGGIVARLSGSTSTISNCVVYKSTINASTIYIGGSGPIGYAGGIVASYSSGTITNCHVKDGSKIINVNADGGSTLKTGALVGNMSSETTTSITSNFYYYDVTVETQLGSSDKETKSGYTPRGTSDNTEDPTGAMLYTKYVIIPISTDAGHVSISSDYYYQVTSDDTNTTYSVAPDVEVVISVENADVEGSYTLDGAKTIELKPKEGSTGLYTFDMPNADVTFTVQEAAAVSFSEEGQIYVTYYNATKDVAVPLGMTAYIVTGVSEDDTKVIVSPVSYIKKGVAVLIEKDKTTEVSETTDFSGSKLIYAENDVPVTTGSKLYVLYQNQFVKVTSGTQIPTGKNYLDLSTSNNAGTRGFYDIGGANDGTSALRGVVAEGTNGKSDAWYTLQGRRLSTKPSAPGLYLHNGIKVVIK